MASETRENAFEQISKSELETKLAEANEKNLKLELRLSETKRMCDAQIKSLNLKQQESEEKIRTLEQTCDVLCAKLAVENDTIELMRYSIQAPIQEQGPTAQEKIIEKERKVSEEQEAKIKQAEFEYEASAKQTADLSLNVPANNANRKTTQITLTSSAENVKVSILFNG